MGKIITKQYSDLEIQKMAEMEMMGLYGKELNIVNPFTIEGRQNEEDFSYTILKVMMNPRFFYFACKYLFGIKLMPYQAAMLRDLWNHRFPMVIGSRGLGKSWILAIHALLRATFIQGRKVCITGAGFRQAKQVFGYAESVWFKSPILRSLFENHYKDSGVHRSTDCWSLKLGESVILCLPLGDGSRIRGVRANDILVDEFATVNREIFETVIMGFAIVAQSPFDKVFNEAKVRVLKRLGKWSDDDDERRRRTELGNQTIVSGTASYQFNQFYDEFMRYKGFIESRGNKNKIREIYGSEPSDGFDYRDYCIMRIPIDHIPQGQMDEPTKAKIKGSINSTIYLNEYSACFSKDSDGFYKRSLIEACTTFKPIIVDGQAIQFPAMIEGNPEKQYVMGVDPASEQDMFSIVIVEKNPGHNRVVYCWTTNNKQYQKRVHAGLAGDSDYYGFCVRKIRNLMKAFNIVHIAMDSQGGGVPIRNSLANPIYIESGEKPIYLIDSFHPLANGKVNETDRLSGLHILEWVSFSSAEWTSEANHGLKHSFEQRRTLFPEVDMVLIASEFERNNTYMQMNNIKLDTECFDTLEDCYNEIEELKNEICTIEMRPTPMNQREKWDTPATKTEGSKKGSRAYKDRYCALLMAATSARLLEMPAKTEAYIPHGGFVGNINANPHAIQTPTGSFYNGAHAQKLATQIPYYGVVTYGNRYDQ